MSRLPPTLQKLPLPIIGSPLFIISNPQLVIEQCKAGVVGSMPALNARPASQLDEWLHELQHVTLKMPSCVLVVLWQVSTRIAWPRVDDMMPSLRGTDSPETLARHR